MEVGPPGEQLQKDFEEIGETMTQEWLKEAGEKGQLVIDAYERAAG